MSNLLDWCMIQSCTLPIKLSIASCIYNRHGSTKVNVNKSNIFHYAMYRISFPELVFLLVPKKSPDRNLSNVIMFMMIYSIFVTITLRACLRLCCQIALRNTQRFLRCNTCRVIHWTCPEQFHTQRQFNSFIHFLVYLPIY